MNRWTRSSIEVLRQFRRIYPSWINFFSLFSFHRLFFSFSFLFFFFTSETLGATATKQIPDSREYVIFSKLLPSHFGSAAAAGFGEPRNCALRSKVERLIFDMLDFIDLPRDRNRHFQRITLAHYTYGTSKDASRFSPLIASRFTLGFMHTNCIYIYIYILDITFRIINSLLGENNLLTRKLRFKLDTHFARRLSCHRTYIGRIS